MRRSVLHVGRWATSWSYSAYPACHIGVWGAAKCTVHDNSTTYPSLSSAASSTKISSNTCTGQGTASQPPELLVAVNARLVARSILYLATTGAQLYNRLQDGSFHTFSTSNSREVAKHSLQPVPASALDDVEGAGATSCGSSASCASTTTHQPKQRNRIPDRRICNYPGCDKRASYNTLGICTPILCSAHKVLGMVDVHRKVCEAEGCITQPVFNVDGKSQGRFCQKHMHSGMVNVRSQKCEVDLCRKTPLFNVLSASRGRFCMAHKQPGMVNVISKSCGHDLCRRIALYNVEGKVSALFCRHHMEPGMVDVLTRPCEHELCRTRPTLNFEGQSQGRFCKKHKQQGMVDVLSKLCEGDGCGKYPSFGVKGSSHRQYCATHKQPGMVYLQGLKAKPSNGERSFTLFEHSRVHWEESFDPLHEGYVMRNMVMGKY